MLAPSPLPNPTSVTSPLLIRDTAGAHYIAGPGGTPTAYLAIPARQTREGVWLPRAGAVSRLVGKAAVVVVEG